MDCLQASHQDRPRRELESQSGLRSGAASEVNVAVLRIEAPAEMSGFSFAARVCNRNRTGQAARVLPHGVAARVAARVSRCGQMTEC